MKGEQGAGVAKNRLLQAAGQFGNSSYSDVGISQILKQAEVKPPTLYHHFGDKEGLFVSWAQVAIEDLGASIAEKRQTADLTRRLEAIASVIADPVHLDIFQLIKDSNKLERSHSREAITEALQRFVFEQLYEVFLAGMEQEAIRRDPVHRIAAAFLGLSQILRSSGPLTLGDIGENAPWLVERFLLGFRPLA